MTPDPSAILAAPDRTIGAVLAGVQRRLEKMAVPSARLCAEHLVARCLDIPRLRLPLHASAPVGEDVAGRIEAGACRLAGHEPLQYVLGDTEFMGFRFRTDARALIPRPETERLVEELLKALPEPAAVSAPFAVDVGTGSGCILVSLALLRPGLRGLGIDRCEDALGLARDNAAALGVADRLDFACGHLLAPLGVRRADVIAANLPYVPTAEWRRLERQVRAFEPRQALDGGEDGLDAIRELIVQAPLHLRPGGALLLETGEEQTDEATDLMVRAGLVRTATACDLAGRPRMAIGYAP